MSKAMEDPFWTLWTIVEQTLLTFASLPGIEILTIMSEGLVRIAAGLSITIAGTSPLAEGMCTAVPGTSESRKDFSAADMRGAEC